MTFRSRLRHRRDRELERLAIAVAWRLPDRLAYWAAIRVGAHATTGRYSSTVVPELTLADALKRYHDDRIAA